MNSTAALVLRKQGGRVRVYGSSLVVIGGRRQSLTPDGVRGNCTSSYLRSSKDLPGMI